LSFLKLHSIGVTQVLDGSKTETHKDILTRELEAVGIRLNRSPPQIYFKKKKTGGISFSSTARGAWRACLSARKCASLLRLIHPVDCVRRWR
jgi:hypothetical protein